MMKRGLFHLTFAFCFCAIFTSPSYSQKAGNLSDKFEEGSRWIGTSRRVSSDGTENTSDVELLVTERDGDEFEGEWKSTAGTFIFKIEGTIKNDKVNFEFIKTMAAKGEIKNLMGVKGRGKLRLQRKTKKPELKAEFDWLKSDGKNLNTHCEVLLILDE